MYGYVLQDWITVRSTVITPIIQNESDWLGFSAFQDIAFWIDVRGLTPASGTTNNILLELQTAPTKDDVLFKAMTGCSVSPLILGSPLAISKCLLASNPAIPLSTWVRWVLTPTNATQWDVTFRILASANRVAA